MLGKGSLGAIVSGQHGVTAVCIASWVASLQLWLATQPPLLLL
jgi:hypothetical protein